MIEVLSYWKSCELILDSSVNAVPVSPITSAVLRKTGLCDCSVSSAGHQLISKSKDLKRNFNKAWIRLTFSDADVDVIHSLFLAQRLIQLLCVENTPSRVFKCLKIQSLNSELNLTHKWFEVDKPWRAVYAMLIKNDQLLTWCPFGGIHFRCSTFFHHTALQP